MNERTLAEIEEEIDIYAEQGNIGKVLDLVDEHGNTIDKMLYAIAEGDYERIHHLETLGIDITEESFIKAAVKHDQLLLISYQVNKGADIDKVIEIAKSFENKLIFNWAVSWKTVNTKK